MKQPQLQITNYKLQTILLALMHKEITFPSIAAQMENRRLFLSAGDEEKEKTKSFFN